MMIGAVDTPHFADFMNSKDAQAPKTRHLLGIIHQIRQASPAEDFSGELNFVRK